MKTLFISLVITAALGLASCSKPTPSRTSPADTAASRHGSEYYTCPMHPQVHADKPGQCPICHMDLVKVTGDGGTKSADTSAVTISERGQQLANVGTVTVVRETIEHTIRAFGAFDIPEPNKTVVSARFGGRVEKLYVSAVGAQVGKGQPLFDIYSPDVVQAENEYVQAPASIAAASRSKLQLFGLTDDQIRNLETTHAAPLVFTYHSPASGVVVDKKIVEGVYVTEGQPLFEISDLSTLWNIADVYETDALLLRIGDKATIRLQSLPDRAVPAVITFISPVVNPQSRTVKVRLTVSNTGGTLRPNTYTETFFAQGRGTALTVPVSAVLMTGTRNIVYVKTAGNKFEPREVGIGVRVNGKYEITRGLHEGDVVVSEGGYLIDSESQLKSGTGL